MEFPTDAPEVECTLLDLTGPIERFTGKAKIDSVEVHIRIVRQGDLCEGRITVGDEVLSTFRDMVSSGQPLVKIARLKLWIAAPAVQMYLMLKSI